ncbi:MAG: SIMPL domain-containing protein [Verrucomicrobiota bacterium]
MKTTAFFKILPCIIALLDISSASPIPDFPFIAADSQAEREVPPTNATVYFTVLAFAKSSEESTNIVQSALGKVITALKAEGVGENLIRAHDLDKSAVRNREKDANNDSDILGYEVSRRVELKLPELVNYPKIVRTLMAADHVTSTSSIFDTSKRDEVEAELTGEACSKARKKADLLAKGAGVTITGVHAVSEKGFSDFASDFGFSYAGVLRGGPDVPEIPLFVPTLIELRASVNVLYRLAP